MAGSIIEAARAGAAPGTPRLAGPPARPSPDERVAAIARVRWVLGGAAFVYAAVIALIDLADGLRLGLPWPLFVVVLPAMIAAYNLLALAAVRRGQARRASWVGIGGDLLAVTIALEGTGGAASWLWTLYPLITLEAAFLSERPRATAATAVAGVACYLVAAVVAERQWPAVVDVSRMSDAVQTARGLVGLQASWVALMNGLAATAGLMLLGVLARVNRQLREAYRLLDEQYQAQGQLERLKAAFLSAVSHEMRTPLAVIQGHAEAMADAPDLPPGHQAAARAIEAQVGGLGGKISQILEYTTLAAGDTPMRRVETDLAELLQGAVEAAGPACVGTLVLVEPVAPGLAAALDPTLVCEALRQLLRNACAATPAGGVVQVAARVVGRDVLLEVLDAGPGLPAAVRTSLGTPFTQGSTALTEHQPGLGLGLAYARLVATLHGGVLEAVDRPGGGTVARLRLPAS